MENSHIKPRNSKTSITIKTKTDEHDMTAMSITMRAHRNPVELHFANGNCVYNQASTPIRSFFEKSENCYSKLKQCRKKKKSLLEHMHALFLFLVTLLHVLVK